MAIPSLSMDKRKNDVSYNSVSHTADGVFCFEMQQLSVRERRDGINPTKISEPSTHESCLLDPSVGELCQPHLSQKQMSN